MYDDTIVVPVIHPTVNSEPSDDGSTNSDHTTGHYIRSVSVPLSDSRNRLDDYVDRLVLLVKIILPEIAFFTQLRFNIS